jgi:hypothetical protein
MLAAVICTALSAISCNFISYKTVSLIQPRPLPEPFFDALEAKLGFFRYAIGDGTCDYYDYYTSCYNCDQFNTAVIWQVAMYSSVVSAVFLFLAFFFASVEYCCVEYFSSRFWISLFFILASVAQGLTFLSVQTEGLCTGGRECQLEIGGILSIVAAVLYFICAVLVCVTPKPEPLCKNERCCSCCKKKDQNSKDAKMEEADEENQAVVAAAVVVDEQPEQPVEDEENMPNDEERGVAAVEEEPDEPATQAAAAEEAANEPENH